MNNINKQKIICKGVELVVNHNYLINNDLFTKRESLSTKKENQPISLLQSHASPLSHLLSIYFQPFNNRGH